LKTVYGLDKLPQRASPAPALPFARFDKHHITKSHASPTMVVMASGRQVHRIRLGYCAYFGGWQTESDGICDDLGHGLR
jgi:hypothetical protein